MKIDRNLFYPAIRASNVCGPTLSQTEVDGLTGILDAWDKLGPAGDLRHIAYTMATAWHEARLDLTIEEIGKGKGKAYGKADPVGSGLVYYGRGACQITWRDNYLKFGKLLGLDLVGHPDLACEPLTSAEILVIGSRDGLFRSDKSGTKSLARYFSATVDDPVNARDIINGDVTENGRAIAGYHNLILKALTASVVVPPVIAGNICPTCHRPL